MGDTAASTPRGTRAPRIKQEDLREQMLQAAENLLDGRGLGVNAYPLNMEDLIRRVGVPRSSAFHAFGSKENLVFQLALRLLEPNSPLADHFSASWAAVVQQVVAEYSELDDAAGHRALLRETIRRAVRKNHEVLAGSARWRTFRALSMSLDSFPDDERVVLSERLRLIQDDFVRVMSACYEGVFERFGVRLSPGLGMPHFAAAVSAALEGIATNRAFGPPRPEEVLLLPGVDGEPVEWHLSAVAFLALTDGMTRAAV